MFCLRRGALSLNSKHFACHHLKAVRTVDSYPTIRSHSLGDFTLTSSNALISDVVIMGSKLWWYDMVQDIVIARPCNSRYRRRLIQAPLIGGSKHRRFFTHKHGQLGNAHVRRVVVLDTLLSIVLQVVIIPVRSVRWWWVSDFANSQRAHVPSDVDLGSVRLWALVCALHMRVSNVCGSTCMLKDWEDPASPGTPGIVPRILAELWARSEGTRVWFLQNIYKVIDPSVTDADLQNVCHNAAQDCHFCNFCDSCSVVVLTVCLWQMIDSNPTKQSE